MAVLTAGDPAGGLSEELEHRPKLIGGRSPYSNAHPIALFLPQRIPLK